MCIASHKVYTLKTIAVTNVYCFQSHMVHTTNMDRSANKRAGVGRRRGKSWGLQVGASDSEKRASF